MGRLVEPCDYRERQPLTHSRLPKTRVRVDDLEAKEIVELLEREQLGFTRASCDVPKLRIALFERCLMSRHESPWIAVNRPPSTRCARMPEMGLYL